MKPEVTRAEARQVLTEDPVVLWFREALMEQFDPTKRILGAGTSEQLWQAKGIAEVLLYIKDVDRVLDLLDINED